MSEYRCPQCKQEKAFTGSCSVLLDMDGDGIIDADSFDVGNVDFDSYNAMVCGVCGHSDTASRFETVFQVP